ncbi:hypothetical protein C8T65DRAFT_704078 [Cerioporus squamosus]|nr:hypothetical protein C8T65DRAFT_704078 [Cerioporus squamosus]
MRTNLQDPLCSLALILAFLISKVLPRIAWDTENRPAGLDRVSIDNPHSSVTYFRMVPWTERVYATQHKGARLEDQYFTIAAICFLAWMDPNSPLRKHLHGGGTITQWNNKHGPKYLHTINLIRLGIAYGKGPIMFKSPRLQRDYRIFDVPDLHAWSREIFGHDVAEMLAGRGHFGSHRQRAAHTESSQRLQAGPSTGRSSSGYESIQGGQGSRLVWEPTLEWGFQP